MFSLSAGAAPRQRVVPKLVLALVVVATAAAFAAGNASAAYFYCNRNAPPQSECGPFNVYDANANVNQAYAQHQSGRAVCERATVRYHAATISLQCGGSPVDSGCDMLYAEYGPGVEFSMYAIDNEPRGFLTMFLVGKASHSTTVCI